MYLCKLCNQRLNMKPLFSNNKDIKFPDQLIAYECSNNAEYRLYEYFESLYSEEFFVKINGINFAVINDRKKKTCTFIINNKEFTINSFIKFKGYDHIISKLQTYAMML